MNFYIFFMAALALISQAHAENAPVQPITQAQQRSEFTVAGHHLHLQSQNRQCVLQVRSPNATQVDRQVYELTLGLQAPCYFLTWQHTPAQAQNRSKHAARPVGSKGEPMAWRYSSLQNAAVLAIIGDPLPEPHHEALSKLHCASSVRGLLLHQDNIELLERQWLTGRFCVESGEDEKLFWILAHPRKPQTR